MFLTIFVLICLGAVDSVPDKSNLDEITGIHGLKFATHKLIEFKTSPENEIVLHFLDLWNYLLEVQKRIKEFSREMEKKTILDKELNDLLDYEIKSDNEIQEETKAASKNNLPLYLKSAITWIYLRQEVVKNADSVNDMTKIKEKLTEVMDILEGIIRVIPEHDKKCQELMKIVKDKHGANNPESDQERDDEVLDGHVERLTDVISKYEAIMTDQTYWKRTYETMDILNDVIRRMEGIRGDIPSSSHGDQNSDDDV